MFRDKDFLKKNFRQYAPYALCGKDEFFIVGSLYDRIYKKKDISVSEIIVEIENLREYILEHYEEICGYKGSHVVSTEQVLFKILFGCENPRVNFSFTDDEIKYMENFKERFPQIYKQYNKNFATWYWQQKEERRKKREVWFWYIWNLY